MSKNHGNEKNIPEYFSSVTEESDVMDAFLTQFALKISKMHEKLILSAVDAPKISSKRKVDNYQRFVCSSLNKFTPKSSLILSQISTFSSLASSNPPKALESILEFCPVVLGSSSLPQKKTKTILSFFPPITDLSTDLSFIIGFFSDCIFSILATAVFEPITAPDDSVLIPVLDRIFKRDSFPSSQSFAFKILCMALKSYKPVVYRICTTSFLTFSAYFNKYFPFKKRDDAYMISFMIASSGIMFTPHDYSLISSLTNPLLKIFLDFSENENVSPSILEFFCNFLPNIKDLKIENFVNQIEKKCESLLKTQLYQNAMKLIGVIHYIKPPSSHKKRTRFLENRVLKVINKSDKTESALDYLISYFKPNENVPLNWSPQASQFVTSLFPLLIGIDFAGFEDKAAKLIEYMAAIDLPTFTSKWLPMLLSDLSACTIVTLHALNRILNPMSGLQTIAGTIPTNATANMRFHLLNIVKEVQKYMTRTFSNMKLILTNVGYDFISAAEILETIPSPSTKAGLYLYDLSPQILNFLLLITKYHAIRPLKRSKRVDLETSEAVSKGILSQWKATFETPYDFYGDIFDEFHLPLLDYADFHFSENICLMPLIPIILHFTSDYKEISQPLLNMILSDDSIVSISASIIYEIICLCYRKFDSFLLLDIFELCKTPHILSAAQLHQLFLTFSHCLKISAPFLDSSIVQIVDSIGFIALNSPYPETRQVGLEIIKNAVVLTHFSTNPVNTCFYEFYQNSKNLIEMKVMKSVVSSFSSLSLDNVPTYKLPTIQLKMMCLSPFLLIWKYALIEISTSLQKSTQMSKFVLFSRELLIENARFFTNQEKSHNFIKNVGYNELNYLSNTYIYLFSTADTFLENLTKEENIKWSEQSETIRFFIDSLVISCFKMKIDILSLFSFALTSINITAITPLLSKFLRMLEGTELSVKKKDSLLELMSLIMRRFSMLNEFNDYIGKMIQSRMCDQIFRFCDTRIALFTKIEDNITNYVRQMTDYLIFRGQYFKYLHQTRLENPHGPIPRISSSTITNELEISPIISKIDFFNTLLKWSLYGEESPQLLKIFGHVSRTALTYLVSLVNLFDTSEILTLDFLSCCSMIASYRPAFLKHLLTHHFHLFFDEFLSAAFTSPLDIGVRFFLAIAAQFGTTNLKDSMIYSNDTFIKNATTMVGKQLTSSETDFVNFIYLRTGKIILLGLFYMLHNELKVRQTAMKMIAETIPMIILIHNEGDMKNTRKLFYSFRKHIALISTNIESVRSFNTTALSSDLAETAKFCTEQFLSEAFNLMPKIPNTRRMLTRSGLLQLISPWMKNIKFDLVNRYVVENPCCFFITFSPSEFITKLCKCTSTLPFELDLWNHLINGNKNIEFLILALLDFATNDLNSKNFILEVLAFLYRVHPSVAANVIVPYLQFENWYFQMIQLGKYEEIKNLNDFLFGENDLDDYDSEEEILEDPNDDYIITTDFALDALILFANEDVVPLFDSFPSIASFCLTHLHRKKSMECLSKIVASLKNTFDIGAPYLFDDMSCLLKSILNSKYENLQFVIETTDSPMTLLHDKKVSVTNLALNLCFIFEYFVKNFKSEFSKVLMIWSLACGDLKTSSLSLDIFTTIYSFDKFFQIENSNQSLVENNINDFDKNQHDINMYVNNNFMSQNHIKNINTYHNLTLQYSEYRSKNDDFISINDNIIKSMIESICLTLKCLISSKVDKNTICTVADFLNSEMRAFNEFFKQKDISLSSIVFSLIIYIVEIGDPLTNMIIVEAMNLIKTLITNSQIDIQKLIKYQINISKIFLYALVAQQVSAKEILDFLNSVLILPKDILSNENDFVSYMIAILPLIYSSLGDLETISKYEPILQKLTNLFDKQTSQILKDIHTFTSKDKKKFATIILSNFTIRQLSVISSIFSQLIEKNEINYSIMSAIYELSAIILEFCHNSDVLDRLSPVKAQALLNQTPETIESQSYYINFLVSSQLSIEFPNAYFATFPSSSSSFSQLQINNSSEESFSGIDQILSQILNQVQDDLHLYVKKSKHMQTYFTKIEYLPPMYPFEHAFLNNPCLSEITELCRRIEVLPFTIRAIVIYKAQNFGDINKNQKPLKLNLDIPFHKLIDNLFEEFVHENDDEEENIEKVHSKSGTDFKNENETEMENGIDNKENETESEGDNDSLCFVPADAETFLPSLDCCNEMVASYFGKKLQPIPPMRK
ncbi:hypothetical protein TRFO_41023 [Tritrichomonas foetus]|uniref:Uncharacterized protein n=1 Tax=Tritrichomonas foetus TaxID=1144522 RepID=A0A1J4L1U7_9EUKA|nr:hypothetical protein TRFO_41023 [Tritrichomonas foetus]|eukprot:OHT17394.1 hypothetical protein TRFO_41023 [Tritrichomonas foetus]